MDPGIVNGSDRKGRETGGGREGGEATDHNWCKWTHQKKICGQKKKATVDYGSAENYI